MTTHSRKIALACLGAMLMLGSILTSSAGALGTVTVTPNPIPMTPDQKSATVTVKWTGQKPNTLMFVVVCGKSINDPTFNVALDCATLTLLTPNGTPTGANQLQLDVFRGAETSGDNPWGCFAPGDTAPAGITKYTTCYVRVTNNVISNKDDAAEAPFTFEVGGAVVPEAPIGILLPVFGALAAFGGFFFLRRRAALS